MKKWIALLVSITLVINISAVSSESTQTDYKSLWGIPYGISIDEFIQTFENKTSILLDIKYDEAGIARECVVDDNKYKNKPESIAGYNYSSVSIMFYDMQRIKVNDSWEQAYIGEEGFCRMTIEWPLPNDGYPESAINMFEDIAGKIETAFGEEMRYYLDVADAYGVTHHCFIENEEGALDRAIIYDAVLHNGLCCIVGIGSNYELWVWIDSNIRLFPRVSFIEASGFDSVDQFPDSLKDFDSIRIPDDVSF